MLRPLKVEDVGVLMEMYMQLSVEAPGFKSLTIDTEYVGDNLKSMIQHESFLGCIDNDLRGVLLGVSLQQWYDPDFNAFEQILYVFPEHRGGMLAARLIKRFEALAKERGCIYVHAGSSTLMNTEQTMRLYECLGYSRVGSGGSGISKRIN